MTNVKPIAIVLPQFHPIPENDRWWGEGFTEWRNVVKAWPRFKGHYQPHLPKHLGFYDMRLPETREAQAELAKTYGIYGFCYYHYWFSGRRILERPVDAILESGKPEFPFMLCWANENWTRNWDGGFNDVLLAQNYSASDFILHARHLVPYFRDYRYIRIGDRPVFAIYKDASISNLEACLDAFREELHHHGVDVYLCRFERNRGTNSDAEKAYSIFDAGIEFQPLTPQLNEILPKIGRLHRFRRYLMPSAYNRVLRMHLNLAISPIDRIYMYKNICEMDIRYDFQRGLPIFPGVSPGWDNSPRRARGALIFHDSTPTLFETWVENKIKQTCWELLPESFLFVNAWNEWAEGNHLEPCERWGLAYLEALQRAIDDGSENGNS